MIGSAVSIAPKTLRDVLQKVTPLLVAGVLESAGLPINLNNMPNICPSRNTYMELLKETATETMLVGMGKMKKSVHMYVIADKANSDKKGAVSATFPKLVAF